MEVIVGLLGDLVHFFFLDVCDFSSYCYSLYASVATNISFSHLMCTSLINFFEVILASLTVAAGHLPLTFRTPPVSPPRPSYLTGMRRVCSLEFRPHLMHSQDSGLADPLLGSAGSSGPSERSFLPQSTIYNWSCGHFSKPLLTPADDSEEMISRREEKEKLALDLIAKCQHSCEAFFPFCIHTFSCLCFVILYN